MLRIGFIAVAMAMASMAGAVVPAEAPAAALPACHPGQPLDLDCALRALDADGDGGVSPSELVNFAVTPAPAFDGTLLAPPQRTGLDFKDAAVQPEPVAPPAVGHEAPPTMLSALLALGALVVLLRRRPG